MQRKGAESPTVLPSRPSSERSPTSRPHRYLQEAACKLGEDSLRAEKRRQSPTPELIPSSLVLPELDLPRSTMKSATTETTASGDGSSNLEMWRRVFHAEAMDCVHAMQAVVERTKFSHFATRFDDWRKVDLKATAQVQMHVKELTRLNQSVEHFLHDCGSLGNLANFKDSFLALNQCVSELTEAKQEITASIDTIADKAAVKVAAAWQAEVHEATEKQHLQWVTDSAKWSHLEARISQLQTEMRDLSDVVRKSTVSAFEAVKDHLTDLFQGSGGLGKTLESIEKRMGEWEIATNTQLVKKREQADQLQQQVAKLEDAAQSAKKRHLSAEEAWHEMESSLNGQMLALQAELQASQESLRDAHTTSWRTNLQRLNELDAKGNLQVNRQTGTIRFVNPVDFTACKPTQRPNPELANPAVVERAAAELAEIAGLFGGPMLVEVHVKQGKGGTPAFWDELADAQAAQLRLALEAAGVPGGLLTMKGLAGSKGQGTNVVLVKLDPDLFPEQTAEASAKPEPKQRAAESPRPRGR